MVEPFPDDAVRYLLDDAQVTGNEAVAEHPPGVIVPKLLNAEIQKP
jgi:hypothetical protein